MTDGASFNLHNPADMPEVTRIAKIEEPWIRATIMTPDEYLGAVLTLCTERRGEQIDLTYAGNRAMVVYRLPLNEVVFDFYDRLKSVTRGYASFDYAIDSYKGINILNGVYSDFKHVLEPEPASTTEFQDTIYSIKDSEFLKIGIAEFEKGKSAIAFNYKNEFCVLRLWTYNLKGRELLIDALITKYGNPSSREKGEIEEKIIWVDNKNSTELKLNCIVSPFNDGLPPDLMTLILSNQKSLKAQEDFEKSQTLKDL